MKLGKLLASGKSIMNGRAEISYRSSKQIYLPKFGSDKNPFKPESPAQTEKRPSATGVAKAESEEASPAIQGWVLPPDDSKNSGEASGPRAVSASELTPQAPANESVNRSLAPQLQVDHSRPGPDSIAPARSIVVQPSAAVESVKTTASCLSIPQSAIRSPQLNPVARLEPPAQQNTDKSKFNPFSILRAVLPARKARRAENTAKGHKLTPTQTELSLDSVKVVHNDLSDVDVEVVPIKSRAGAPDLPVPKKSWEFVGERLFGVEAT